MNFADRYGPWAVVAGASDGVGAAFAEALAERGLNVVLLARRQAVLDEVATGIAARTGVQTRTLVVDLAHADANAAIFEATNDLDVGFLVYCAGGDPNYEHFLDGAISTAEAMIHRNCVVPAQLCHHFAPSMVERGSGGIVLFGSGAGFVGAPNMAVYGSTKAFDMIFAEALWSELHHNGVDVLGLVLGKTDTPALRQHEAMRGSVRPADQPLPDAVTPGAVVAEALESLGKIPTCLAGEQVRVGMQWLNSLPRVEAVALMAAAASASVNPG